MKWSHSPSDGRDDTGVVVVAAVELRPDPGIGHAVTPAVPVLQQRRAVDAILKKVELRRQIQHVHVPPLAR
jgi:hypothetical protein